MIIVDYDIILTWTSSYVPAPKVVLVMYGKRQKKSKFYHGDYRRKAIFFRLLLGIQVAKCYYAPFCLLGFIVFCHISPLR